MLKAVYLDDKEHKYLIDFILSYKDSNNKNDINAAIRFLIIKGYQSLHEEQNNNIKKTLTEKSAAERSVAERSVVEKTVTEKTLTEAIEQLYTKINNDINNKFSMQLLENNSQLMSAIINMANKSNNTPQIIPQPYIMSAPNISMPQPQQNNAVINTNNNINNNNANTSGGEDLNNIQNKKMSNIKHKNFSQDNINTENNIIAKAKNNTLSTNSLLSNLLSNANR